jgi:hypothetical protein
MVDDLRSHCANNKSIIYTDTEKRLVVYLDSKFQRRNTGVGQAMFHKMELDYITVMSNIVFKYDPNTKELMLVKSRYLNDYHVAIKQEKEYLINLLDNPNTPDAMFVVLRGDIFNPHLI